MSQIAVRRLSQSVSVTLATSAQGASTLNVEGFAGGGIEFGTLSTSFTSVQMWAASTPDGTYRRLRKSDGSAVDLTLSPSVTEGGFYALPTEVFSVPYLRVVSGAAAGAGVAGTVTLKS
jgi:hypothetical protein